MMSVGWMAGSSDTAPAPAGPPPAGPAPAGPGIAGDRPGDTATPPEAPIDSLPLRLDGFEGPLDLLLELARGQKVDLAKISILALVEQYLAVIEGARRVRLELAADWLVMAAWLTWLKSRLLVPTAEDDLEAVEDATDALTMRLRDLERVRIVAVWLSNRPYLGQDVFPRGAPEDHTHIDRSRLTVDQASMVRAYLAAIRRGTRATPYVPRALTLWTVQDALKRLASLVASLPDWASLEHFLPAHLNGPMERRAAWTSTLLAGLEMARDGMLHLRQDEQFGPISVHRGEPRGDDRGELRGTDVGEPRGDDRGEPRGIDVGEPRGTDRGELRGTDRGKPRGTEGEHPGGTAAEQPGDGTL